MRLAIIAFDALNNAQKRATLDGPDADVLAEFNRLKAAREPVGGLLHVLLISEDRGRLDSYLAVPAKKKESTTMKKVLAFILPLLLLITTAQAQLVTFNPVVVYQNVASNLATPLVIDCRGQKEIALEWSVTHSGTATTTEGIQIRQSVDGSTATGPLLNMVLTPASGTKVYTLTNITVSGYPYLLVTYITNKDADTYSTNSIKYWPKPFAP